MTCILYYSIIWSSFTPPKSPMPCLSLSPPPLTSGNPWSFYCVYSFVFSQISDSWNYTVYHLFKLASTSGRLDLVHIPRHNQELVHINPSHAHWLIRGHMTTPAARSSGKCSLSGWLWNQSAFWQRTDIHGSGEQVAVADPTSSEWLNNEY